MLSSAASNLGLSSVKSRSTCMFVASDTRAIKSAGCILVPTNFFAASTDAVNLLRFHRGEIKKEQNQAPVTRIQGRRRLLLPTATALPVLRQPETVASAAAGVGQIVYFSKSMWNFLLLAILEESEVSLFQIANEIPLLVVCHNVHQHEFIRNLNARLGLPIC